MSLFGSLPLFLLGFGSLMPLINPIGTALIIDHYIGDLPAHQRKRYAFKITFYCLFLGLGTLGLGSWCLKFMGISIPAIQVAGGFMIARMGLSLIDAKVSTQADPSSRPTESVENSLFYPLAFPLTLGPGGIATLITLSAHAHADSLEQTWIQMGVLSLSLIAVCAITYVCFAYSHLMVQRIGPTGGLVLNRLLSFLVFSIGIQMMITGLLKLFPHLMS